jgi:SAM-dependent methyltransferase
MSHDDRLDVIEKEKYEQVWTFDQYRNWSPGCDEQERALESFDDMDMELIDFKYQPSVCDYGCGEGWSVQFFTDAGYKAWGVEHAKNAVKAAGILVYEECLWDMTHLPASDYAFCCDVMEHIPPNKVNLVLSQIAWRTRRLAWFRIATVGDNFGPTLLKKPLHLTVEPASWWRETLLRHFDWVDDIQIRSGFCVFRAGFSQTDVLESMPQAQEGQTT